jgi:hypothetical protein
LKSQICSTDQPFIADLVEHGGNQAQAGSLIGEDAHHTCPAANFPVSTFHAIGGANQAPVSSWVGTLLQDAYARRKGSGSDGNYAVASNPEFLR